MLRGLYTAAAGMITQQRVHDTVTNNIANLNTPGFKQAFAAARSFPEMSIVIRGGDESAPRMLGKLNSGVLAEESVNVFAQGDLKQTDSPTDFALLSDIQVPGMTFDQSGKYVDADGTVHVQPQAFFTLQGADGAEQYTRNGKFEVSADGYLVNADGLKVLGANGQPIQLDKPMSGVAVSGKGQLIDAASGLQLADANGQPVALLISRVEDPNKLLASGNGVYTLSSDGQAAAVAAGDNVTVRQGYEERSNVNAAQSAVDLMTAMRAYEANQKVIQYYDKSLEKAVNEVGKV